MSKVIQAKCPHCQNILRIPADWVAKALRCKHCKKTFQAKAKAADSSPTAIVAKPKPAATSTNAVQAATPAKASTHQPFGFDEDNSPAPTIARRKKKGSGAVLLLAVFFFLFLLGAAGAGAVFYKIANPDAFNDFFAKNDAKATDHPRSGDASVRVDGAANPDGGAGKDASADKARTDDVPKKPINNKRPPFKDLAKKDGAKPIPFSNDPFPRRALLININHYLMFNTVLYGSPRDSFKGGFPGSSTAVLRDRLTRPPLNFPAKQVVELSDGIPPESKVARPHSTQKSVLEMAIRDFVDTSREQDRVIVLFCGHATSLEDKSYLIPIDGNLKNAESLLPLKWVYDELAKCKAQQKILILDVFRFSPSRGFELPSAGDGDEGTMPESFDKDLQTPPAGVQVWSSCQKDQSAVELEGGSAFIQALCHVLQGGPEMTGIAAPSQPILIDTLVVKVNQRLKEILLPEKRTQMSRLTGKASDAVVAPNPAEPAVAIVLKPPTAPGGEAAGIAQVNNILDELKIIPSVRDTRVGEKNLLNAHNLPAFAAKKLDAYKADGYQNIAELKKRYNTNKEMFDKEFPLRGAYFEALIALEESDKIRMREVLPGPIDPKRKAAFLLEQAGPGISIFKLKQALAQVKEAAEKRDAEVSKRWQANFDYLQARLQSRLVYLFEYSYTLGQIRADNLPELAPGQSGWRIGTGKKIAVTESEAKALSKDTKKLWQRIETQYPGTPWALLAQRESLITLGLAWRPKSD
jgi:hypothetical protein